MPRRNSNAKAVKSKTKRSYAKKSRPRVQAPASLASAGPVVAPGVATPTFGKGVRPWKIPETALALSRRKREEFVHPFVLPARPPLPAAASPEAKRNTKMAMDQQIIEVNAWAAEATYNGAFYNGMAFAGFPYLSELAQRPEYRRLTEVLSTEMTRKWISIKSKTTVGQFGPNPLSKQVSARIDMLLKRMDQLDVRGVIRKAIELDGFFGRGHVYIDTKAPDGKSYTDNPDELKTPIGDGGIDDADSQLKFGGRKGFIKSFKCIEPVWTYPARYNATDPLKDDWYNPQSWLVQGKELHISRLLLFVGREVPDLLKPAYNFGGISLSQLAKPYVDNWLRTRQSVADLIWTFSVMVLKTDMNTLLGADGTELMKRAMLFSNLRTNQGLMMLNKDSEDFSNVSAPLSGLEALQAQSQEHMCSVTGTPVVKLLGIQPAGLNASSQGELQTWYDWVAAFQEKLVRRPLTTLFNWCQRDVFGQVYPDLYFEFEPIEELTEEQLATVQKTQADTDNSLVQGGIIDPSEVRKVMSGDPNSRYNGIDPDEVPEPPMGEEDGLGGIMGGLGVGEGGESGREGEAAAREDGERPEESLEERTDPESRRGGERGGENGAGSPRVARGEARGPRKRDPRPPQIN